MPRLKPETQHARREQILDAAERCIARSGFHGATMADICAEAKLSPGALYGHFASKEALIAGIAERDRNKLAGEFKALADAPDLFQALQKLGEHYTIEEPRYKRVLCVEIGAEATRNAEVGAIFRSVDSFVLKSFEDLFARAAETGRISPRYDPATLALLVNIIGEGLFWRRAIDPEFDPNSVMPAVMSVIEHLLNAVPQEVARPSCADEAAASPGDKDTNP
ncbi:MAG: TetR/AcrR family transcriptional regulator [Hyphomicrobiaceae bacterium]|nr:TetR/AcrR family transcriptional regulator [Hyphomicrobiaceae bacterium]